MRKEATIEQWKELYEAATRIKEMKPQHKFWDLDIIGIREGNEEDTTFYSILGTKENGINICRKRGFNYVR